MPYSLNRHTVLCDRQAYDDCAITVKDFRSSIIASVKIWKAVLKSECSLDEASENCEITPSEDFIIPLYTFCETFNKGLSRQAGSRRGHE